VAQVLGYILPFNRFQAEATLRSADETVLGQVGIVDKK
jgi:hypothetical protein